MNCVEFQACLEDQIEPTTVLDSDDLRSHRSECEACRSIWDQLRLLDGAIGVWRDATPDCDFAESVISKLFADGGVGAPNTFSVNAAMAASETGKNAIAQSIEPRSERIVTSTPARTTSLPTNRGRNWRVWLGGLAAALVLSLVIPLFRSGSPVRSGSRDDQDSVVNRPATPTAPEEMSGMTVALAHPSKTERGPAADGVEVRELVEEAGMAYLELAESTASVFRDAADLLPPATAPSVNIGVPPADGTSGTEWMDGLGDGLKPIGESVSQAFDFLWRAETERAEG